MKKILFSIILLFSISGSAFAVRPYTSPKYSTSTGKTEMSIVGGPFTIYDATDTANPIIVFDVDSSTISSPVHITGPLLVTGQASFYGGISPSFVQQVSSVTIAFSSGTTILPLDDTIPQSNEGDQYLEVSITPKKTTNVLDISVNMQITFSSAYTEVVALFKNSESNAIASVWHLVGTAQGATNMILRHTMVSGTTSPITFKVRAGAGVAGTTQVNGASGARYLGGSLVSGIWITEYEP